MKSPINIIHAADLHLTSTPPRGISKDRLMSVQNDLLFQILNEKPNILMLSGDIFDNRSNAEFVPGTLERQYFAEFLKTANHHDIQIVMIAGNHDNDLFGYNVLAEYSKYYNNVVVLLENGQTCVAEDVCIIGFPYSKGLTQDIINPAIADTFSQGDFLLRIIAMHSDIKGLYVNSNNNTKSGVGISLGGLPIQFTLVYCALGHYHVPSIGYNYTMPGIAIPKTSLDYDKYKMSYVKLSVYKDRVDKRYIVANNLLTFKTLDFTNGGDYKEILKATKEYDSVRVIIKKDKIKDFHGDASGYENVTIRVADSNIELPVVALNSEMDEIIDRYITDHLDVKGRSIAKKILERAGDIE